MKTKILQIEQELNSCYLERKDVIRGLLVGLLTKQHVLLLGPPGTAKSMVANDLCSRIGGQYFQWLLSRTSTTEELFGPYSLKALENDSYRRVTKNKLPEANVAFIDEIFKCNSAVLNTMLSVLNERIFFNDGAPVNVPLEMAVGASNELPEDREELGALWDRFLLRYTVGYIKDPRNFEKLLATTNNGGTKTTLTEQELQQARVEVEVVDITRIIPRVQELRQKMVERNIPVSDRRWRQALNLIKAQAWLEGRKQASDGDLEILTATLWVEQEQIQQVRQAIMSLANPLDMEALDLLDQAMEIWQEALNAKEEKATAIGSEANAKLKQILKKLEGLKKQAADGSKNTSRIKDTIVKVAGWNKEVVAKCLGITL
jgi:MoxR-like ATPase